MATLQKRKADLDVIQQEMEPYLNTIRDEIGQVQIPQTANEETRNLLGTYLASLNEIQGQYLKDDCIALLDAAYKQLNDYLDAYFALIEQDRATFFKGNDPKIILHIGKRAESRRYPLTKVWLIAIPDEDIHADPKIWTSLAHELGHFIYWNSEFKVPSESKTAQQYNTLFLDEIWKKLGITSDEMEFAASEDADISSLSETQVLATAMGAWSEEIFADTLGVYLAGEEYFTQSKKLYLQSIGSKDPGRLVKDGDHPVPFLRPYIAAKALEYVSDTPNNLWRRLKDEIRNNYLEKFRQDIQAPPDSTVTDEDLVLPVQLDDQTNFEINVDDFKSAIVDTIPILAEKIKTSTRAERPNNTFELIVEYAGPGGGQGFAKKTKEGLAYWIKKIFKGLGHKKNHD